MAESVAALVSLPMSQGRLRLTRRGRRTRLSDKEEAQTEILDGIHPTLVLLESSERTCRLTQPIEFPILLRLSDGLSIYAGLKGT
jgi:hypothetical protein